MNGYPVQKPWRAMTHGRGPPEWRTTAADAVWFGPNDAQRSLPGSPCRGTNSLGNESRSYAIPSAHPRPMSGAPATRAGGWRWYDAGWAIQPRRTYMARAAASSTATRSKSERSGNRLGVMAMARSASSIATWAASPSERCGAGTVSATSPRTMADPMNPSVRGIARTARVAAWRPTNLLMARYGSVARSTSERCPTPSPSCLWARCPPDSGEPSPTGCASSSASTCWDSLTDPLRP